MRVGDESDAVETAACEPNPNAETWESIAAPPPPVKAPARRCEKCDERHESDRCPQPKPAKAPRAPKPPKPAPVTFSSRFSAWAKQGAA
jgi:hypothetical protein